MKKRYVLLVLIVGFGAIFWLLVRSAVVTGPVTTTAGVSLQPEALPASKDDMIIVDAPLPHASVASPLIVRGKARGGWYSEGTFPVVLMDNSGTILAHGQAHANGEWMTTQYVPFTVSLIYTAPGTPTAGYLVLHKDNPSGDPTNDNTLSLPVIL